MAPPSPRPFNQTERITSRLHDLVRSYPKDLGIIKEFLQNADDAGASILHVILDRRTHSGKMDNSEQELALGPALLFINDRTFTERDIRNIQFIGGGGKLNDAGGTGRFGQGFNTCFSVSDHPSLLTGDWAVWFDPHHRAHGSDRNAWAWSIADVNRFWPAWATTFACAGHSLESSCFEGTIFRLPLRSEAEAHRSEILSESFSQADFEAILNETIKAGPALLVFLRSVLTLRVDEIGDDGTHRQRFLLETVNSAEVEHAHSQIRDAVRGEPAALLDGWLSTDFPLPRVSFKHVFRMTVEDRTEECVWCIVTGLFRGPENALLDQARAVCSRGEKALPWAGAAAPLEAKSGMSGLACFLPLPESSPWPVLLHGWFDLDSARRGITRQAGTGETAQARVTWNRTLLRHAVGPAWAFLVECLRHEAAKTEEPYARWLMPTSARDEFDQQLVRGFYAEIGALNVFSCVNLEGVGWYSLAEIASVRILTIDQTWHQLLRDPLVAAGFTLIEPPLPDSVVKALRTTPYPAPELTAELIQEHARSDLDINCQLEDAPWEALQNSQWVISLARFCSEKTLKALVGLSLALLADGRLHTFGRCGSVFLVSEFERTLLAALPHRMLSPAFQKELNPPPEGALGVKKLDLAAIVECAREILRMGQPTSDWLAMFFDYLEQVPPALVNGSRSQLNTLRLLPDDKGKLRTMGFANTPMLVIGESGVPEALEIALQKLGIPRVSGPNVLVEAVRRFSSRHLDFVYPLTPDRLATAFSSHVSTPWINMAALADREVLAPILDYLSPGSWLQRNDSRIGDLRRLALLPTVTGSVVAADTKDLYIPGGFQPPSNIKAHHTLLDCGEGGKWVELFRKLRVSELDGYAYVVSAIIPTYANQTDDAKIEILRWFRDNLRLIESGIQAEKCARIRTEIRKTAILPLKGGGWGAPRRTFRPDAETALGLLGDVAKVPDLALLGDDSKRWLGFFIELDLLLSPLPEHLVAAIQSSVASAAQPNSESHRRLSALREYIAEHWESLTSSKQAGTAQFAHELASFAWLSAVVPSPEVVAVAAWPTQLYKPSEVVALRLLELVASVHPVADTSFPDDMSRVIGLRMQVSLADVLRHFSVLRSLEIHGSEVVASRARIKSFAAITQHIARLSDADFESAFRIFAETQSILVRGKWWLPRQVFLEPLPFSTEWCVSILEDPEISGHSLLVKALVRLGVRPRPEPSDWIAMLQAQHIADPDRQMTDLDIAQIHGALQQLRVETKEWLRAQVVPILTTTRRLRSAREALLPDDPRLKRVSPLCPLPLVEETEIVLDIARMAGARSLRQVLEDELTDDPVPSQEAKLLQWAYKRTEACRSPEFYEALRRLAWHEAVVRGNDDPAASAANEKLTLTRNLSVLVARTLRVTSTFLDTGEVVFEQQTSSFWDEQNARVWLSEGSERRMGDNLSRTLATMFEVDPLRVSHLLDVEPEEMEGLLDDDDISVIPSGERGSLPPAWTVPELVLGDPLLELADETSEESPKTCSVPVQTEPRAIGLTRRDEADDEKSKDAVGAPAGGGCASAPAGGGSAPAGGGSAPAGGGSAPAGGGSASAGGGSAPREPGFGSSRPWSPDAPQPSPSGARRLRSYVHRESLGDYDTGNASASEDGPVRGAAVQRVVEWEKQQGRTATPVSGAKLGYDLVSSGQDGERKIKVIGIDGSWTARGVGLSDTELPTILEGGKSWWLYVVEHVRTDKDAPVHPISNPFLAATEFRFDSGWRSAEDPELSNDPHEGEVIVLDNGIRATVVHAEPRGQFWSVTLRLSDDSEIQRLWHPSWRRN